MPGLLLKECFLGTFSFLLHLKSSLWGALLFHFLEMCTERGSSLSSPKWCHVSTQNQAHLHVVPSTLSQIHHWYYFIPSVILRGAWAWQRSCRSGRQWLLIWARARKGDCDHSARMCLWLTFYTDDCLTLPNQVTPWDLIHQSKPLLFSS